MVVDVDAFPPFSIGLWLSIELRNVVVSEADGVQGTGAGGASHVASWVAGKT